MPIEVGVCLYGPFTFEGDCRPISPIVWLCLQGNTDLKKPMTVTIPHVLRFICRGAVLFWSWIYESRSPWHQCYWRIPFLARFRKGFLLLKRRQKAMEKFRQSTSVICAWKLTQAWIGRTHGILPYSRGRSLHSTLSVCNLLPEDCWAVSAWYILVIFVLYPPGNKPPFSAVNMAYNGEGVIFKCIQCAWNISPLLCLLPLAGSLAYLLSSIYVTFT